MPTTPNHNLPYPALADAPNGPAAFEALAEATEAALDGVDAIPTALFNAKGDLVVATSADTANRLAVGANGNVLTADSSQSAGVKWAPAAVAGSGSVATSETTSSTSYTDLATPGPAVTVTVGASGIAVVTFAAWVIASSIDTGHMSFVASGANTVVAQDLHALLGQGTSVGASRTVVLTGLTPGSTTFTAKYKQSTLGGAPFFSNRTIGVVTF